MQVGAWPSVEYEERPWISNFDASLSRRARMAARGPYRAAVPGIIALATPKISSEVLALVDDASRELARFDTQLGSTPMPMSSILLRSESASSSGIEQITASSKHLALAELGSSKSGNAQLVVANVHAMSAAMDLSAELGPESIIEMHRILMEDSDPRLTGHWRQQQVWIGGGAQSPHRAHFVPPHHERVDALMNDLVQFIARTDLPVLIMAALAHAQFETIHPFPDGNGRTGRALIHSVLKSSGLVRNATTPISAGLLSSIDNYFDALTAYREGEIEPIIIRLAEASFEAVTSGRWLVEQLAQVRSNWNSHHRFRAGSAAQKMPDLLLQQPVVSTAFVAKELNVSVVAATNAIEQLEGLQILTRANFGSRNRLWQAPEVLDILDDFASRVRRRGRVKF